MSSATAKRTCTADIVRKEEKASCKEKNANRRRKVGGLLTTPGRGKACGIVILKAKGYYITMKKQGISDAGFEREDKRKLIGSDGRKREFSFLQKKLRRYAVADQ